MEINSTAVRYVSGTMGGNVIGILWRFLFLVDGSVQHLENDGTDKPDTESCC